MARASIDHDFARFRSTGDPDALARVFDEAAPRLLLVAGQLAPQHAEDLLQATFVCAIERAERYDPQRPLWPWLTGILAHEARALQRKLARRPEPDRIHSTPPLRPDEATASDEGVQRIAQAVDELPEPFARVVALRVIHGLEPVQIARALRIPASTVRSRLHRGLARLRATLPAGLAGLATLTFPPPALAAVRARVLAAAARHTPTTAALATAPLYGPAIMKKLLAVTALLLLAVVGSSLLVSTSATDGIQLPPPTRQQEPAAPDFADATTARTAPAQPRRHDAALEAEPDWLVHGRVTAKNDDGTVMPFAGAEVHAVLQRGELRQTLGTATTAADGSYRIAAEALVELSELQRRTGTVVVHADASGWLPATAKPEPRALVTPHPLQADLQLAPQHGVVTGRAVTAAGDPIAGAHVFWRLLDPQRRPFHSRDHYDTTNGDGTFRVPFDDDGEYTLGIGSYTHGQARQAAQHYPADRLHDVGRIVLRSETAELNARVVMVDGSPAADLAVEIREPGNPDLLLHNIKPRPVATAGGLAPEDALDTRTDADGRIRARQLAPGRYLVRVRDRFGAPQDFAVDTGPGGRTHVLDGQLIRVRVLEPGVGPLPGAPLCTNTWPPGSTSDERSKRSVGSVTSADASRTFLSPWGATWTFECALDGAAPTSITHRADEGVGHADLELPVGPLSRTGTITFDVRTTDGSPPPDLRATLSFPRSGAWAFGTSEAHAPGTTWRVPAGTWRLSTWAGDDAIGPLRFTPEHREMLVVGAGHNTPAPIRIPPRGLVCMRLTGDAPEQGAWRQIEATLHDGRGPRPVENYLLHVAGDDEPETPEHWQETARPAIRPDQRTILHLPVRPGHVTLTVTAAGHRPGTCGVRVRPFQLVEVEVPMTPRRFPAESRLRSADARRQHDAMARARIVWDDDFRGAPPEPARRAQPAAGDGIVRIRRETSGRGGKTVTTVRGVPLAGADLTALAKELKKRCGVGGAVKDGVIEIQGDQRDTVERALQDRGYQVKRAGG